MENSISKWSKLWEESRHTTMLIKKDQERYNILLLSETKLFWKLRKYNKISKQITMDYLLKSHSANGIQKISITCTDAFYIISLNQFFTNQSKNLTSQIDSRLEIFSAFFK